MNEQRVSAQSAWGRVSYPVFEDDTAPKPAAEMNAFYEALREAVLQYAAQLNERREDGLRLVSAEYVTVFDGERITVTYTLTVRRRGRVIGRKRLTHVWEEGVMIPPQKMCPGIFRRRRGAGKG